jgi:hypothetical protein
VILKESYRTKMHVFFESLSPSFARRGLSTQVGRARIGSSGSSGSSPQHRISKIDSTSFIKNPLLTKVRLVGHLSKTEMIYDNFMLGFESIVNLGKISIIRARIGSLPKVLSVSIWASSIA